MLNYYNEINKLRQKINEDFEFYRKKNSLIDRRLNELGKRGDIRRTADEMQELLKQRQKVKDASLQLMPIWDLFRHGWDEAEERFQRALSYSKNSKGEN
ncbi:hypothetical protein [Virgibacillus proomii]|uniref:hypothetical protein n=1 Tax=Virgibacillus proomii TaxID=84407 RepID=UPI001C104E7A|nr:hypothetical protein [Virgibacillus proomii]MBU5265722.1 hypothetical protein [Virgibacillus proomii]